MQHSRAICSRPLCRPVARRIRRENGDIYLVALTGYGGSVTQGKAERAGFDLHLTKPVDSNRLHAALEEVEQIMARQP